MTREALVQGGKKRWESLAQLLKRSERARGAASLTAADVRELAELYRSLAADLMRVRRDKLGADLERYLDDLASRAHNTLYAGSTVGNRFRARDLLVDFPAAVRRAWPFFLLATILFYGPMFIGGYAAYSDESYALAVLPSEQLQQMAEMHGKSDPTQRDINTDGAMTGYYVWNNVGIAFRCFATGLAFGLGSLFFLIFNGLVIGVVFGHLARVGVGPKIFSFVAMHSSWELTAIVISAAAGLQMGFALVRTGGRTRLGNLRAHGMELLRQVTGAAFFLLVAALIEGNLSPSELPNEAKYVLGVTGWVLVALILALGGRRRALPEDVVELRKAPGERGPSLRGLLSGGRRRTAERAAPLVTPNASGTTRSAP